MPTSHTPPSPLLTLSCRQPPLASPCHHPEPAQSVSLSFFWDFGIWRPHLCSIEEKHYFVHQVFTIPPEVISHFSRINSTNGLGLCFRDTWKTILFRLWRSTLVLRLSETIWLWYWWMYWIELPPSFAEIVALQGNLWRRKAVTSLCLSLLPYWHFLSPVLAKHSWSTWKPEWFTKSISSFLYPSVYFWHFPPLSLRFQVK